MVRIDPVTNADRNSTLRSGVRGSFRETVNNGTLRGTKCPMGRRRRMRNLYAFANFNNRALSTTPM